MARTECDAERLTAGDERILKLERGTIAGHTCTVIVVDPPPDEQPLTVEGLRARVACRLDRVPRCRQRLAPTPLGLAPPLWVDDIDFDVTRHVHQLPLHDEIDERALRCVVARLMEGRLDRRHPLWSLDMARLTGGRTALLWREHHCMADGMSGLRVLAALLWDSEVDAGTADPAAHAPTPSYSRRELLRFGLTARARTLRPSRQRSEQRRVPGEARRLVAAVRRELLPGSDLSPLAARVGAVRTVGWLSGPVAELHDAGKTVGPGVTVNDVVLAVVAGGIRRWLAARRLVTGHIRVKVPVSLHRPGERPDQLGNRDSFIFVDLPVEEPDVRAQLIAISRETSERKAARDADELDALVQGLEHLPLGDRAVDLTMSPRVFALNVSNVPGPPGPLSVLGGRVASVDGVAEVAQGHALRVAARSSLGWLSFGLCADTSAVPDLDLLIEGMRESIDDLRRLTLS